MNSLRTNWSCVLVNQKDYRSPWQLSILNAHNNKLSLRQITCHIFISLTVIYFSRDEEVKGELDKTDDVEDAWRRDASSLIMEMTLSWTHNSVIGFHRPINLGETEVSLINQEPLIKLLLPPLLTQYLVNCCKLDAINFRCGAS